MVNSRDRVIGIVFIVISAFFFCTGALIFFNYLKGQSGISHLLPADKTVVWLELADLRGEIEPLLQHIFPAYVQDIQQRLSPYKASHIGFVVLDNDGGDHIYYFGINKAWQLGRYLALGDNNRGQIQINGIHYYLLLSRSKLFIGNNEDSLNLIGPQYNSLRNDISYQRLRSNLPRNSWGKLYYRVDGLFGHIFDFLGYEPGDMLHQITAPILEKMGAVGACLDLKDGKIELSGIQSLPLKKLAERNGNWSENNTESETNINGNKNSVNATKSFVGYLANFVPQNTSLLFINGQDLVNYYSYASKNLLLNEPLSAKLIGLWAKGISQRTGIKWQEDIFSKLNKEYGFIIGLNQMAWEALIPVSNESDARTMQDKILFAIKSIIPALHPIEREVILPDDTKAKWLVTDPAHELIDNNEQYDGVSMKGLRFTGQSETSFITAWYDGVLFVANNARLIKDSISARKEDKSLAKSKYFQDLSKDFFVNHAPYVYGNLAGFDLNGARVISPALANFLSRFCHFIARQEVLGSDVILKASLSP